MENTFINVSLAFIEGLGLILSPCILPILPIVLSGSLDGDKRRPLGIIVGFVIAFALFTFFSRQLVQATGIDLRLVRDFSYVLLVAFGIMMLSTYLTEKFARLTQRLANVGANSSTLNNSGGGFVSGMFFGALIGLIWTPCAGPILAAVIVQTVIQKTTLASFLIIVAFALGAGIPMLFIALFGRVLMTKLNFFKRHTDTLRKLLGVIILLSVGLMIYNDSSASSLTTTANNTDETSLHQNSLVDGITPFPAPAIDGIVAWINSQPLQLSQLHGKVVLIDFWTYSCINCIRTLPYLKDWYQKYHDKGLVIIGVHTPEFEFEKNLDNIKAAVIKDGIHYPVAVDSNFVTWQNFKNQYWPAHYLIDPQGNVVYQHFGEGNYDVTENNIRFLLGLNKTNDTTKAETPSNDANQTPETYFGYERAKAYSSPETEAKDTVSTYSYPTVLNQDQWALKGKWKIESSYITSAESGASLKLHFQAKKVYIVMGNAGKEAITVNLRLNGETVVNEKGRDVTNSTILVPRNTLYEALQFPQTQTGILEIIANRPGLQVYTFTFG